VTAVAVVGDRVLTGSASGELGVWMLDGELLGRVALGAPIVAIAASADQVFVARADGVLVEVDPGLSGIGR
jgi:hypothetical protein